MDDIIAILLALLTPNVELSLLSICFGNCTVKNSLRNILTLFNVLNLERIHREKGHRAFDLYSKPKVAIGLETALDGSQLDASDFHGSDGLGNVHETAPWYTAKQEWIDFFSETCQNTAINSQTSQLNFIPSLRPSYLEILDILKTEEPDSVVIVAIGPLMNLAKASQIDPVVFSRVKHIVSMGGALNVPGNITPFAEFNIFSDSLAAKTLFDLTQCNSSSQGDKIVNPLDPAKLTILPLDLTGRHLLLYENFCDTVKRIDESSPLVQWTKIWMYRTFDTYSKMLGYELEKKNENELKSFGIEMHDPLAVWYAISIFSNGSLTPEPGWVIEPEQDIRIETHGEWTKGMTLVDKRARPKKGELTLNDQGVWLSLYHGNRINVVTESPFSDFGAFGRFVLQTIYGL